MATWISKDDNLTESEKENNAGIIYSVLDSLGYSLDTIAALTGNMDSESTLSPGLHERGGTGYGLVQWTPGSKLQEHCTELGISPYTDGTVQLKCVDGELFTLKNEWYSTEAYIKPYYNSGADSSMIGLTPEEFKTNSVSRSVEWLTVAFMVCYLRPSRNPDTNHYVQRQANAVKWYEYFSGHPPTPPIPAGLGLGFIWDLRRRKIIP